MAQSAASAAQPPPDPFDSFCIFEGGQNISTTPSHRLHGHALVIRQHAWKSSQGPHPERDGTEYRECVGVSQLVNRIVNTYLLLDSHLTQNGEGLATLLGGDPREAGNRAAAFRAAAQMHHSVNWSIDQGTETATFRVPVHEGSRQLFPAQQGHPQQLPDVSLSLENNELVPQLKSFQSFGCVKAPGFDDRKWVSIDLILTHLRSSNRGSFHISPNIENF